MMRRFLVSASLLSLCVLMVNSTALSNDLPEPTSRTTSDSASTEVWRFFRHVDGRSARLAYGGQVGDDVLMKTTDGRTCRVSWSNLSTEDKQWVLRFERANSHLAEKTTEASATANGSYRASHSTLVWREFNHDDGRTARLAYSGREGEQVLVRTLDGRICRVLWTKLSIADQQWIRQFEDKTQQSAGPTIALSAPNLPTLRRAGFVRGTNVRFATFAQVTDDPSAIVEITEALLQEKVRKRIEGNLEVFAEKCRLANQSDSELIESLVAGVAYDNGSATWSVPLNKETPLTPDLEDWFRRHLVTNLLELPVEQYAALLEATTIVRLPEVREVAEAAEFQSDPCSLNVTKRDLCRPHRCFIKRLKSSRPCD